MNITEYVQQIQDIPDQQFAIMAFDLGVNGAPLPPIIPFAQNFDSDSPSVRGPWMATSKSEMAQNAAVHTETMLLNRLRGYLDDYIESEGRRPYSLALYSKFSPCRHCAANLINSVSHPLPGDRDLPDLTQFGFKDHEGWMNGSPNLKGYFGLLYFQYERAYVNPAKSSSHSKSWYASEAGAQAQVMRMRTAGWR